MSQSGIISLTNSSGGAVETLTPNSGGPVSAVGNNINVQGLSSNSGANTFPIFSYNGGAGQFNLENRTYLSSYVVDTSVTNGSKGTFSTLGAAITQGITDVGTTATGFSIYLRNVNINETITVSANGIYISILGTGGKSDQELVNGNPVFSGSFTNSGTSQIVFSNVDFSNTASLTNSGSGVMVINDCYCASTIVQSNSSGITYINSSTFAANSITLSGGTLTIDSSTGNGGTITFSNAGSLGMFYSEYSGSFSGSTSSAISLFSSYVTLFANTLLSGTLVNFNSSFGAFNYYSNSNVTYGMGNTTAGNVYQAVRSAISYTVVANQDYYIGITNTGSARTVTLPATNIIKNQAFIVKDESIGAGAHNITVSASGGKTIDGASNFVINTNGGSATFIYDGTNYFVI